MKNAHGWRRLASPSSAGRDETHISPPTHNHLEPHTTQSTQKKSTAETHQRLHGARPVTLSLVGICILPPSSCEVFLCVSLDS